MAFNDLKKLPVAISEVTSLISLDVSHNQIAYILPSLAKLANLQSLNLESNNFLHLPSTLYQLS